MNTGVISPTQVHRCIEILIVFTDTGVLKFQQFSLTRVYWNSNTFHWQWQLVRENHNQRLQNLLPQDAPTRCNICWLFTSFPTGPRGTGFPSYPARWLAPWTTLRTFGVSFSSHSGKIHPFSRISYMVSVSLSDLSNRASRRRNNTDL
jgi:hypothetical protein